MIIEKEKRIPVIDTFDLVVVRWSSRVAAALAAARNNVSYV